MGILAKLLAPILPTLLNWAGGKLWLLATNVGDWLYAKVYNWNVKRKLTKEIELKREAYNEAKKEAYDGAEATPAQLKKLRDASRDLAKSYEYRGS